MKDEQLSTQHGMRKSIKNCIPKYNASGFLNFCPSHVHLIMQVNFSLFHHHQQCAITSHISKMCLYVPYYGGAMNEETSKASDKQTAPLRGLRSHAYTIFTSNYELHNKALMRMRGVTPSYRREEEICSRCSGSYTASNTQVPER